MDADWLSHRFPVLYHMAEDESWESIRRIGLLSTSALLDRFGIGGNRRYDIESRRRPEIVKLEHPEHGTALIRDNKPMQETALERCLQGMTPREWYESLNRKVFFWVDQGRLSRLLGARTYRDRPHLVLEVDTAKLLERHAKRVSLSPINSGATIFGGSPRGSYTFLSIIDYPNNGPVVELAVDYAVPDAADLTLSVSRWHGTEMLDEVWSRPS